MFANMDYNVIKRRGTDTVAWGDVWERPWVSAYFLRRPTSTPSVDTLVALEAGLSCQLSAV